MTKILSRGVTLKCSYAKGVEVYNKEDGLEPNRVISGSLPYPVKEYGNVSIVVGGFLVVNTDDATKFTEQMLRYPDNFGLTESDLTKLDEEGIYLVPTSMTSKDKSIVWTRHDTYFLLYGG